MPMRFDEHGFAEWVEPSQDPFDEFDDLSEEIVHLNLGKSQDMGNKNKRKGGKKNRRPQKPKGAVQSGTVQGASAGSENAGLAIRPLPESAKALLAEKDAKRNGNAPNPKQEEDDWWDSFGGDVMGYPTQQQKGGAVKAPASTGKTTTYFASGGSFDKGAYAGGFTQKCRHYNFEDTEGFDIKGIKFFPSSMNNERKDDDLIPDWGLYLDWGWKHPSWRAENIDWRDYGLPTNYVIAFEAMVEVVERATRGEKVEIGCIGGHGRTGTALACIAVILGMAPKEAIEHVRKNYCSHTLETDQQEWFVSWCYSALHGLPIPPMPERKVAASTSYKAPAVCNFYDHFYMWLRDMKTCTRGATCSTFKSAVTTFEKEVPNWLIMTENLEWHRTQAKAYKVHPGNPKKSKAVTPTTAAKPATTSYKAPNPPALPAAAGVVKKPLPPSKKVVDGFLIPIPGPKDQVHVINNKGCVCDLCRYRRAGHEMFLEPFGVTQGAMRTMELNAMEARADAAIRLRTINEAQTKDELVKVFIATHDKGVVEVIVDSNFPVSPTEIGKVEGERRKPSANGTDIRDFEWRAAQQLWVYDPLGPKD